MPFRAVRTAFVGLSSLFLASCGSADGGGLGEPSAGSGGGGGASSAGRGGNSGVSGESSGGGGNGGIAGAEGGTSSAGTSSAGTSNGGGGAAPNGGAGIGGSSGGGGSTVGGSGGAGPSSDPAPGKYGQRAMLPAANSEMAVAEAAGKIYVLGGYPSSRVTQDTVQAFDPKANSWSLVEPLPVPIHHPVAVGVNGKLYSLGGQLGNNDENTNRTFEYDPVADAWRELAAMPTPRGAGAGAAIDDKIYVVGGRPEAGNAFEVYDISENAWTPLPDLPQMFPNRNHIAAAAIDGKIYVAGGRHSGGSFSSPMTASLDIYDPATQRWTTGASMLRPRGGVNGVAANGCFFVWGGEGPNTGEPNDVFPDHDVYDPIMNRWTALDPLPIPVHGVTGAVFLDGLIYIPGGGTRQGGNSGGTQFQVYRPARRCE